MRTLGVFVTKSSDSLKMGGRRGRSAIRKANEEKGRNYAIGIERGERECALERGWRGRYEGDVKSEVWRARGKRKRIKRVRETRRTKEVRKDSQPPSEHRRLFRKGKEGVTRGRGKRKGGGQERE